MKAPAYAHGSDVNHFSRFCRGLVQSTDRWDGKPLELYPAQLRMLSEALSFDESAESIWSTVVNVMPRKNGKTSMLAAIALYKLVTSDGSPEILLAAASDKQAGRLFDACAAFVRRSPGLGKLLRVREYIGEVIREDGRGRILRMSSDPARLHGYNPSMVVCDELAQWEAPSLRKAWAALTSGGGARTAPQTFVISTAGDARTRHTSILGRICDMAEQAQDAEREPGLLVARMPDARMLCWLHSAPTTDPHDTQAMKIANPAPWITLEYLKRQADSPELSDSDVLQLHGCVWAESDDAWLASELWASRAAPRAVQAGEKVVLGFDGSYRRDATALYGATLDGFVFEIEVRERPAGAPDDWAIPRGDVDQAVADAMERFDVVELACDPPGWHAEIEAWQATYGDVVVAFDTNQSARMAPACDRFRGDVIEGELSHDGSPVLARHIANCAAKEGRSGVVITKGPDRTRKIDAAVAAVVAYDRARWHADRPEIMPLVAYI